MSNFEFITVLLAIIVGIGITHLLLSIGRLFGETRKLNVSAVQIVWTANILFALVAYWWWVISLRTVQEWTFFQLLLVFVDVCLWCLLSATLYPNTIPPDYDLAKHFEIKRKSLFSILIILSVVDPIVVLALGPENLFDLGWPYLNFMALCLAGGIAGIRVENQKFQFFLASYWGISAVAVTLIFPALS